MLMKILETTQMYEITEYFKIDNVTFIYLFIYLFKLDLFKQLSSTQPENNI